jgi:hypothetical protein
MLSAKQGVLSVAKRKVPAAGKWIRQIWNAKAAKNGGIVRRKVSSVKKYATVKDLKAAVKGKGFHMIRTGGQFMIFCHAGDFKVVC